MSEGDMAPMSVPSLPGPARDLVGYGPNRPRVVWPNGAAVALSIVVNYEEGSEASKPDGDARNEGMTEVAYAMPKEDNYGVYLTKGNAELGNALAAAIRELKADGTLAAIAATYQIDPATLDIVVK